MFVIFQRSDNVCVAYKCKRKNAKFVYERVQHFTDIQKESTFIRRKLDRNKIHRSGKMNTDQLKNIAYRYIVDTEYYNAIK